MNMLLFNQACKMLVLCWYAISCYKKLQMCQFVPLFSFWGSALHQRTMCFQITFLFCLQVFVWEILGLLFVFKRGLRGDSLPKDPGQHISFQLQWRHYLHTRTSAHSYTHTHTVNTITCTILQMYKEINKRVHITHYHTWAHGLTRTHRYMFIYASLREIHRDFMKCC